uniref:Uncharacterized protein n=1 Tax=Arundo donax TaxID=35708 RepID=A0A0A9GTW9_ARUDO
MPCAVHSCLTLTRYNCFSFRVRCTIMYCSKS